MKRPRRYRIEWLSPWDGRDRPKRILTMSAKSKADAEHLHNKLFPAVKRRVLCIK